MLFENLLKALYFVKGIPKIIFPSGGLPGPSASLSLSHYRLSQIPGAS